MESKEEEQTPTQSILSKIPIISVLPSLIVALYIFDIILLHTLKLWFYFFFVTLVIGPLIFKNSYFFQRSVIFLNFVNVPKDADYSNPSKYGLEGAFNFFLVTNENIKLGVWHILPENLLNNSETNDHKEDEKYYNRALDNGQDVVIYNHGNSSNRVAGHRIELYQVLRKHFHVIAYDYRGYGDSSKIQPSEVGVVNDCLFVYKWLRSKTKGNIYIWGHSLGTGISTHTLSILASESITPAGLILESPFTNLQEEIFEHPLANPFRHLPWFNYTVTGALKNNNFRFESDKYVTDIDCPILILHAEDDGVVPFKLGNKLYKMAKKSRTLHQGEVSFCDFHSDLKYGHKYICRAPELESIIRDFVFNCTRRLEKSSAI